jgi:hypothetical protein
MAQRCTLLAAIENTSHFVWLLSFLGSHYIVMSQLQAASRHGQTSALKPRAARGTKKGSIARRTSCPGGRAGRRGG